MRLSLYTSGRETKGSFITLILSKDEVKYLCNGFSGGVAKLRLRSSLRDGLILVAAEQGYSLGTPQHLKNYADDVGSISQISCRSLGARQYPPLKPPLVLEPERITDDGRPALKMKPLPDLTIEGAAPFNPAINLPEAEAEPTPTPAVPEPPAAPPTPAPTRRDEVLPVVARHSHNDPELTFAKPTTTAPRQLPAWAKPKQPEPAPSRPPTPFPVPEFGHRHPETPPPPHKPAEAPPPVRTVLATNGAGENARADFKTLIELINDEIAKSAGALGVVVKDGKLRGFSRRFVEEEL